MSAHSSSSGLIRQFNCDELEVKIFSASGGLAGAAANEAAEIIRQCLARQRSASVIFAAATSQVQFLEELAASRGIDWKRVTVFHMDEYLGLPVEHPASFRRFIRERVVDVLHPNEVHYIDGEALEPMRECQRYERLLRAQPIDLCCLGIGENGHIAFNDPGVARFNDQHWVKLVRLDDACRQQQVGEKHFRKLTEVPAFALTLTVPALCASGRMVCVVPDKRKANAVKATLESPIAPHCPASILRRQTGATLFLDANSASELKSELQQEQTATEKELSRDQQFGRRP